MDTNVPKNGPTPPGAKDTDNDRPTSTVSRMKRRHFLHAGVLGLAGAASFGGTGVVAGEAEQRRPGSGGGTGQGRGSDAGPAPPTSDVSAVVGGDPETWNEPWVWRPADWPGQQLHLNVVENQSPSSAVGLGNPGGILFSYGGDTPGPTIRMKGDETLFIKLRNLEAQGVVATAEVEHDQAPPGCRLGGGHLAEERRRGEPDRKGRDAALDERSSRDRGRVWRRTGAVRQTDTPLKRRSRAQDPRL